MKRNFIIVIIFLLVSCNLASSQEKTTISVGSDIVSSYVWRGTRFGNGAAFQPSLEFGAGGFTAGVWGSYGFADAGFSEADIYAAYAFDFGLSLGLTKYYFPGVTFFKTENHAFEVNTGFETGALTFSANYILNEGAGSAGGDLYFEAGIATGPVNWFVGGGDGWHTPDGKFGICNVGLTGTREIKITDTFSLPLFSSVILNPKTEQFFVVFGITL
jgi:hypothetical protein